MAKIVTIGLTGSVAMGKSFVKDLCSAMSGVKVGDADHMVHKLMWEEARVISKIKEHFPQACSADQQGRVVIERKILASLIAEDANHLKKLETILQPHIKSEILGFIRKMSLSGHKIVLMEIPLLFEANYANYFDVLITVTAPGWLQEARVAKRPNMSPVIFKIMKNRQLPDHKKRVLSDHLIYTGLGKYESRRAINAILRNLING
jgi:dephospho-CoA kinase